MYYFPFLLHSYPDNYTQVIQIEWHWPKEDAHQFNLKDDFAWKFGPELPEPLCCAGQISNYDRTYLIGGSTPSGGFLVKFSFLL